MDDRLSNLYCTKRNEYLIIQLRVCIYYHCSLLTKVYYKHVLWLFVLEYNLKSFENKIKTKLYDICYCLLLFMIIVGVVFGSCFVMQDLL